MRVRDGCADVGASGLACVGADDPCRTKCRGNLTRAFRKFGREGWRPWTRAREYAQAGLAKTTPFTQGHPRAYHIPPWHIRCQASYTTAISDTYRTCEAHNEHYGESCIDADQWLGCHPSPTAKW